MAADVSIVADQGASGSIGFKNLFGFSGRMRRTSYWQLNFLLGIVGLSLMIADQFFTNSAVDLGNSVSLGLKIATAVAIAWMSLTAIVRRLHDLGLPGSWLLVSIPINFVVSIGSGTSENGLPVRQAVMAILVLLIGLLDGSAGLNRFGPDPRARSAAASELGLLQFVARRVDRWTVFGLAMVGVIGLLAHQLAMPVARLLPKAFTMRVGERAISNAVPQMYRCKTQDTRASLERLADRLDPELSVHIHVTSHPYVEGLALVGGNILVGQDTLRSALVPEEIAALMAHELAHVRLMHVERALVSQLAFSALPGSLANVFNTGWGLAYSRDQEREADAMAIEILTRAGIDPHYLGSLLERLEQERFKKRRGNRVSVPSWLATHPSLPERLSTIAKAQRPVTTRPAMTSLDWVDVHIGCY